jgi:hypothetical protein
MDQKTSILINRQVPEFVREEYPLFVSFIEAYYEFLETKQGTKNNDLLNQSKKLKSITDVDVSIDEFEEHFFNIFASLIPVTSTVDKAFLIKNVLPLYKSKGSENSFKFLFRLLFNEEVEITYPRINVLRASDGKWKIDKTLKVSFTISSVYTSDGVTAEYNLLPCKCPITGSTLLPTVDVYVNGALITTGFTVYKNYKKLVFDSALDEDDVLEVFYRAADRDLLLNRKVTGLISGASTVVEKLFTRVINNDFIVELYVDDKQTQGEFQVGEILSTNVIVNDELIECRLRTISELKDITVKDSGANYNIGDPVVVIAPQAFVVPTAIVSKVFKGNIDNINILETGAGFKVGGKIFADNFGPPFVDIEIVSIDVNSPNTVNSFSVFKDIISDIDPANTTINAASYGLSAISGNQNTIIQQAFSDIAFTNIGEIIGVQINSSEVEFSTSPLLDAVSASLIIPAIGFTPSNTTITIKSFGSLGKTTVHDGGTGYQVGDTLQFVNQPGNFGLGAAAEVTSVNANGSITEVTFVPYPINGTANGFTSNVTVIGTGTFFLDELTVGSNIKINGQNKTVVSISSNTSINVNSVFANNFTNRPIRLYEKYLIGGQNYSQAQLPTVNVVSSTGSNANVAVIAIFGDGEILQPLLGNNKPGGVQEITIVDAGDSLTSVPMIDLSNSGDGQATATANLIPSFEEFTGRWTNSDGILSAEDIRIQGLNYYIDQSYVVKSSIEFNKYKNILKTLLHPAGSAVYSEVVRQDSITIPTANVISEISLDTP